MRSAPLRLAATAAASLSLVALAACSGAKSDASTAGSSAISDDGGADGSTQGACSLEYWDWVLHKLEPQMDRPATEISEDELMALVATHPDPANSADAYSVCWTPVFNQYFTGKAVYALHQASVTFGDSTSADYLSYPRYLANIAVTPELRRNMKAILALQPATMQPSDADTWMSMYDEVLAESIRPVGTSGLYNYENVVENEWVISAPEAEYLTIAASAGAAPGADGVYGEWISNYFQWVLGPPPAESKSFVFNIPWEPGADSSNPYGLSGIQNDNGTIVMPDPVSKVLGMLNATAPAAIGSLDSGAWWSMYHARALRAIGDLSQQQPLLTQTDTMALDVLEQVKPATPRGLSAYQSWLDTMGLAAGVIDTSWTTRFLPLEPCVDAADLAAATTSFDAKPAAVTGITAPKTCSTSDQ